GHLHVERAQPQGAPRQPGGRDREQRERHVESEQLDRPLADVLAPEDRHAGPGEVGGERPSKGAELAYASVAGDEIPGEQNRRTEDEDVERKQELRARVTDM